jgi:hypothetical protein
MRTFGKIFGSALTIFGAMFDIVDIIGFYRLSTSPQVLNDNFEITLALAFIMVIGTFMIIGGVYIFRKS